MRRPVLVAWPQALRTCSPASAEDRRLFEPIEAFAGPAPRGGQATIAPLEGMAAPDAVGRHVRTQTPNLNPSLSNDSSIVLQRRAREVGQ